jgi:site-specific DNA-methyltransferase (adenine-specific)
MAELIWRGKHLINQHQPSLLAHQSPPKSSSYINNATYMPTETNSSPPRHLLPPTTTWSNRLILGDNRLILPQLIQELKEQIDLIYIDPPFMTGRTFTTHSQLAYHDTWHNDLDSYLSWLYEILQALYTLLANDGSLYIHLDWRVAHYVKIILDEIFSAHNAKRGGGFQNEIIWHYQSGGRSQRSFAHKHDTLFLYTKSASYCFHLERVGPRRGNQKRNHMRKEISSNGLIRWTIRTAGRVYSYDENSVMSLADVWTDINHLHQKDPERKAYVTQKPEALLERIILASSEENDLILDCFCGSGVTATVAEKLGRRWITCDKSKLAIAVTSDRLLSQQRQHPFTIQHLMEEM